MNLKGIVFSVTLAAAGFRSATVQAANKELEQLTRSAKNFSRIQHALNARRSIEPPVAGATKDPTMGGLPVPAEVINEANEISESAESWGCDVRIVEKPKTKIKFGDQFVEVIPFEAIYSGKACPVKMKAQMEIGNPPNQPEAIFIKSIVDFELIDLSKKDIFGMTKAHIEQDIIMTMKITELEKLLEAKISTSMVSEGSEEGTVVLKQSMGMKFQFKAPMELSIAAEDAHLFTIQGKTTSLRRKQAGSLTGSTSEFWLNDKQLDQATFEKTLQGIVYFGVSEKPLASVGTLSCKYSFVESTKISSQEKAEFEKSGTPPQSAPAFEWNNCGKTKSGTVNGYQVSDTFDANWMLATLASSAAPNRAPVQVYFLYDEDSHFIRQIDSKYSGLLSCRAIKKCSGGSK